MAETKLSDQIAELLFCALHPEALTEERFRRGLELFERVRAEETAKGVENRRASASKIDAAATAEGVQNGHRKSGVTSWRDVTQKRLLHTKFSTQQIAEAGRADKLTVEAVRDFAMGVGGTSNAMVRAVAAALDRLEGKK